MNGKQEEVLTTLVDEFMSENPQITVELINQGDYGTLQTKIAAAGSSNTLPTLAQEYSNWMYEYNESGWLTDLNGYAESDTVGTVLSRYVDAFINEVQFDNKLLGIPFNKSTELLFYNEDLVTQAGVSAMPTSFDVTFIEVDHDVAGSSAILIENEDVSILYSGELRLHGKKFKVS